jgi:hypothetical protein
MLVSSRIPIYYQVFNGLAEFAGPTRYGNGKPYFYLVGSSE